MSNEERSKIEKAKSHLEKILDGTTWDFYEEQEMDLRDLLEMLVGQVKLWKIRTSETWCPFLYILRKEVMHNGTIY